MAGGLLALATCAASAQTATGTNAVSFLEDNANNAIGVFWPITMGLIGLFLAIRLGKRFLGKAK